MEKEIDGEYMNRGVDANMHMSTKETSLSEKIKHYIGTPEDGKRRNKLDVPDVREAVLRLKEKFCKIGDHIKIDEIFGDKLT